MPLPGWIFNIYQVPNHKSHLLAIYIICHLPLVFLSPTSQKFAVLFAPLFRSPFSCRICFLVQSCCVVITTQENNNLCDFSNTKNNDFIGTPLAPLNDAESCEINTALLNLVMKDQFAGLPSEDAATHLNNFVDLCDMQN